MFFDSPLSAFIQIAFSLSTQFVGGKKPVEHHAAVWVPDNEANICMHCKRTQFTMLQRRVSLRTHRLSLNHLMTEYFTIFQHHCRNCGAVVCGPCSSKKFLLPSQSTKPVRVCLDCYDSLSQSKNEQVTLSPQNPNTRSNQFVNFVALNPIQTKTGTDNAKSNNNTTAAADSSAEDDSDDEEEQKEAHDEVSRNRMNLSRSR